MVKLKNKKEGQIEIAGLLVIVILITLVLFIYLSFSLSSTEQDAPPIIEFIDRNAINTFGSSVLETSGGCGYSLRRYAEDCAYTQNLQCDGDNSCEILNNTIKIILRDTFELWGYDYSLVISTPQGRMTTNFSTENCYQGANNSLHSLTPFRTGFETMRFQITICR